MAVDANDGRDVSAGCATGPYRRRPPVRHPSAGVQGGYFHVICLRRARDERLRSDELSLSTYRDFIELSVLLAQDGDRSTHVEVDGQDVTYHLSDNDSVTFEGIINSPYVHIALAISGAEFIG